MRKGLRGKAAGLWLLLLVVSATSASAERYLTIEEVQKICFADADRFEAKVVRYSTEQKKVIEKASGEKVRIKGNRYWIAWRGTNLLGVLVVDHVLGKHEIIDYAVAINPNGSVRSIEVLEYRESHGYEIRGEKWREQFVGKTADSKLKLRDDIYNISGATISCRNVTDGVRRVLATYELVVRTGLPADAAAGVPKSQSDGER